MRYIKDLPSDLSDIEEYVWLDKAEKEAKQLKDKIKRDALAATIQSGGFSSTEYGNVQEVERTTKKAKDSLKFFLQDKGYLDLCLKDEIDLSKVQDLVDAGVLDEEVTQHIDKNTSKYLKVK